MNRFFQLLFALGALLVSPRLVAQSVGNQPTTNDHNSLHEEIRLREQATAQARYLGRALHLNEAQIMQVRDFAFVNLHSLSDAEARFAENSDERHARVEEAAARFQRDIVNILTDSQVETYFQLLARQARREQMKGATPALPDPPAATKKQ